MNPRSRFIIAVVVAIALAITVNRLAIAWITASTFADSGFQDGCSAFLTQVLSSFIGGAAAGLIVPDFGLYAGLTAFALLGVESTLAGFIHALPSPWRVPLVAPQAAQSRLLHYLLRNPIVPVTFGSLGGWLASQFATGRFTLADRNAPTQQEMED